ncbi:hypothetical protein [Sphingomonas sp. UYP23]
MAGKDRIQGLADTYAMLGALPDAARDEAGVELAQISRDFLALQQVRVPKDTGALEAGLTFAVNFDSLRARIGLLGLKSARSGKINLAKLFYGIIVDKGRSAQTVIVERRRRVNGQLRSEDGRNRKRVEDIVSTYSLHVKAREAVEFIELSESEIDDIATRRLADFWDNAMSKAGQSA